MQRTHNSLTLGSNPSGRTKYIELTGISTVWLVRLLWEQKVAGSNPACPTKFKDIYCMHYSAMTTGNFFFQTYVLGMNEPSVVEIGSQDINGSLRDVKPENVNRYVGLDFAEGKGVDIVLSDPYHYPLESNSFDVLVTSSCLEHSEMFWLSFLEGLRVLKDDGIMYINVPYAWMMYHRFPVDCWRFWPDAGKALETWARYNKIDSMVLESYVSPPGAGEYVADFVCVILKNSKYADKYPHRMIDVLPPGQGFFNGFRFPKNDKFPHGWEKPAVMMKQDYLWQNSENTISIR
jgi:hypothetical protein